MSFAGSRTSKGFIPPFTLRPNWTVQQVLRNNKSFPRAMALNNIKCTQLRRLDIFTSTDARRDEVRQRRAHERRGFPRDPNPLPPNAIYIEPWPRFASVSSRASVQFNLERERCELRDHMPVRNIQAGTFLHSFHAQFNKMLSDLLALLLDDPNDELAARLEDLLASLHNVKPALKRAGSWINEAQWDWEQYVSLHARLYDQAQRGDSPGAELKPLIKGLERYGVMVGLQLNAMLRHDGDHLEFDFLSHDSKPCEEPSNNFDTVMHDAPEMADGNSTTNQITAEQTPLTTPPQHDPTMQPWQPPNTVVPSPLSQLSSLSSSHGSLSNTPPSTTNTLVSDHSPPSTSYVSEPTQTNHTLGPVQPITFTNLQDLVSALTFAEYLEVCDKEVHKLKQRLSGVPRRINAGEIKEISVGVSSFLANTSMTWFDAAEFARAAKPWYEKVISLRTDLAHPGWKWSTIQEVVRNLIVCLDAVHDIVEPLTPAPSESFPALDNVTHPSGSDKETIASSDTTKTPTGAATASTPEDTSAYTPADVSAAANEEIVSGTGPFDPTSIQTLPHALAIFLSTPFSNAVNMAIAEVKTLIANKASTAMPATAFLRRACTYLTESKVLKWKAVQDKAEVVNFKNCLEDVEFHVLAKCTDDNLNAEAVALGKDIKTVVQWFDGGLPSKATAPRPVAAPRKKVTKG